MKRPRPGFTIRRMMAATAVAVVALALIALGIQRLSVSVASNRQRAALHAEEAAREQAARDRAITIAAREYERMHGTPPPSAVGPGQVAHVIARREADGHDYLVRFGYQHVVNDQRDSSGRPIPFQSGSTVLESFRVKEDGACEYTGLVEAGPY